MNYAKKNTNYSAPSFYKKILIVLFILGVYSRYHLPLLVSNYFVPYFLCLISGVLMFTSNFKRVRKDGIKYYLLFTILNIVLAIITYFTVEYNTNEVFKSILLFEYSVVLAIIFYDEIINWKSEEIADLLGVIIYAILILCLLDLFTPFHEFNLNISSFLGREYSVKQLFQRDLVLHGGIRRPFPLTTEPSHVGKLILIILPAYFYMGKEKNYIKFFLLSAVFLAVVRSPIILGCFILGAVFLITDDKFKKGISSYFLARFMIIIIAVASMFLLYQLMSTRVESFLAGRDASSMLRLVRPLYIADLSLEMYPFFGVGIGNTEYLAEIYGQSYNLFYDPSLEEGYLISSLLAPLVFFGIIGTLLHGYLVVKLLKSRSSKLDFYSLMVHYILLSISMGAFLTVNYWAYLFLVFRTYTYQKNGNYF